MRVLVDVVAFGVFLLCRGEMLPDVDVIELRFRSEIFTVWRGAELPEKVDLIYEPDIINDADG